MSQPRPSEARAPKRTSSFSPRPAQSEPSILVTDLAAAHTAAVAAAIAQVAEPPTADIASPAQELAVSDVRKNAVAFSEAEEAFFRGILQERLSTLVGQSTRWVIGGSQDKPGLAAGATNAFHFVIASDKPFATTNLTAKVTFSRVVLEGGKVADVKKNVQVEQARK